MDLIALVLAVCFIGFVVWFLTTQIEMPAGWARAIQVLALFVVAYWILTRFVHLPNVLPH